MHQLKIKLLNEHAKLPTKAYPGDVCFDVYATEDRVVPSAAFVRIMSGIAIELPLGYGAKLHPRSSQFGVGIMVHGVIDEYRGEIAINLLNLSGMPYVIKACDRIAQLEIVKIEEFEAVQVDKLTPSERGARGFGSSGK